MTSESPPSFTYELRIPKERIAVLIGTKGKGKKELEALTEAHIDVDSKEGDVVLTGSDAIKLHQLRDIVKAIGRGFNPEIAELLMRADYAFELLALNEYSKAKNHQIRIKGRVIGREGKSRDIIEEMTDCHISVYGKTVGIIGAIENVNIAKRAVDMLLSGSPHPTVYKWLEQKRKQLKRLEMMGQSIDIKDEYKKYLEDG